MPLKFVCEKKLINTVGVKSLSPVDIYPFLPFLQNCGSAKKLEIFFLWNQAK